MKGERPRIIDVMRRPRKCPVCGGRVWDIIYGTGDMTEIEFFLQYRREAIMGGDNIPRRPPIWACACGCKRFRKVNADGTDIPVKPKMLRNIRKKPLGIIEFTSEKAHEAIAEGQHERIRHYKVTFTTEYGEKDTMSISAMSKQDAEMETQSVILGLNLGIGGEEIKIENVEEVIK